MRVDIVRFIESIKKDFGVEAIYIPDNDVYSIRYKGRGVQNFNSRNFYEIPRRHRHNMIRALIKVGLNHNFGEGALKEKLFLNRNIGKKI